ncbi:MAG: hypothetical protein LBG44_10155 [Gemmatimonadota bacterium]|jgi:hypothetical protein|nr:hypothetical protein [Gemmatimonadota bacterium]
MYAPRLPAVLFDLSRLHPRTVASLYSNLVTRPMGAAVRLVLEAQLAEIAGPCVSVLDFSQVRVMDYSCADEIVAKLLVRYRAPDRPADAYFVARGLREHHVEAVEAVLRHHSLLMVAEYEEGEARLLGTDDPVEHECWAALSSNERVDLLEFVASRGYHPEAADGVIRRFVSARVAVLFTEDGLCPVTRIGSINPAPERSGEDA